jgi:hypothetical protein
MPKLGRFARFVECSHSMALQNLQPAERDLPRNSLAENRCDCAREIFFVIVNAPRMRHYVRTGIHRRQLGRDTSGRGR